MENLILYGEQNPIENERFNEIIYSLAKEGCKSVFAVAKGDLIDDHFVLWERYNANTEELWNHKSSYIFGVCHDFKEANRRLKNRMERRGRKIAKSLNGILKREIDIVFPENKDTPS